MTGTRITDDNGHAWPITHSWCEVYVEDLTPPRPRQRPREAPRPPRDQPPRATWADLLLADLNPELHKKVVRALARVLHPDMGGDHGTIVPTPTTESAPPRHGRRPPPHAAVERRRRTHEEGVMSRADPLEHWPRCPRRLVLPRVHPDGTRTLACFTCGAQVTYSADWRIVARHAPTEPPVWARRERITP